MEENNLEIFELPELQDCPFCGGAGLLEEEQSWCWYATCVDCGAQTAAIEYSGEAGRRQAAESVAHLWNIGKIMRSGVGE